MAPIVIDLTAESSTEEFPSKAAKAAALQTFLLHNQTPIGNARNSGRGVEQKAGSGLSLDNAPPVLSKAKLDYREVDLERRPEKRQKVRRSSDRVTTKSTESNAVQRQWHDTAQSGSSTILAHHNAPEQREQQRTDPLGGPLSVDRIRKVNEFHTDEATRRHRATGHNSRDVSQAKPLGPPERTIKGHILYGGDVTELDTSSGDVNPRHHLARPEDIGPQPLQIPQSKEWPLNRHKAGYEVALASAQHLLRHINGTFRRSPNSQFARREESSGSPTLPYRTFHRSSNGQFARQEESLGSPALSSCTRTMPEAVAVTRSRRNQGKGEASPPQSNNKPPNDHGLPYTAADDVLLAKLKEVDQLGWGEIVRHFNGRTKGSLEVRYYTKVKGRHLAAAPRTVAPKKQSQGQHLRKSRDQSIPARDQANSVRTQPGKESGALATTTPRQQSEPHLSVHGEFYTAEDNALLVRLKETDMLSWAEIASYFPGRTRGSLKVHYLTKVKGRGLASAGVSSGRRGARQFQPLSANTPSKPGLSTTDDDDNNRRLMRRKREASLPRDGFVPWSVATKVLDEPEPGTAADEAMDESDTAGVGHLSRQDCMYPATLSQLLRQREFGNTGRHGWASAAAGVSDEFKNHALSSYQPRRHFMSTCGDVACLSWAPNRKHFVAGSIAISDDRSMQYNSNLNLLLGSSEEGALQELPEHHVPRPVIDAEDNVNSLHSMRESQDPRLFMTVAAAAFSPNGSRLYTAGSDKKVRMYRVCRDIHKAKCMYAIEHPESVDLLSVSNAGILATACHTSSKGAVSVFNCAQETYSLKLSLSHSRPDMQSSVPLFPSALRWGIAARYSNYLLAGFSTDSESIEEEGDTAGEIALWNGETGQRFGLGAENQTVFDVAWNPSPSSASTAFLAATTSSPRNSAKGRRSIVQCFALGQDRGQQVLKWECPAMDVNDVTYCPYDDNLIAAGATDGKAYIWDKRFTDRSQKPLHVLSHDDSVNVLDHDRERELVDTGIRFLSWGATGSRLYTGSSDGVVKVWNPYRSASNAHVTDVATFQTAIMSGSFSPDYRELLIGEECGRVNLLNACFDDEDGACKPSSTFKLHSAPAPPQKTESSFPSASEMLALKQIDRRPMGDLPVLQAVQGPNYKGPYFMPSADQLKQANDNLDSALAIRSEARFALQRVMLEGQETDIESADSGMQNAETMVKDALAALDHLLSRYGAAQELESAAAEMQRAFRKRRAQMIRAQLEAKGEIETCKLDCNYLPKHTDGLGVPDSHRSEQRIPGAVQSLRRGPIELAELDCKGLFEEGLAGQCTHCNTQATSPQRARQLKILCQQRCATVRASFTAACHICLTPMRGDKDHGSIQLCESCDFTCFRCTKPLRLLRACPAHDGRFSCDNCGISWIPGVLGYEPVHNDVRTNEEISGEKAPTRNQ